MVENEKHIFKYNVSFYYQSTIIYFVAFILYVIIRGEIVEDSFKLIIKDPIIYFFGIIVVVSLIGLLYNIYKKRYLEISGNKILFVDRFNTKILTSEDILQIKISRRRERFNNKVFRFIRLKIRNRRRPLIIRTSDYENEEKLIQEFHSLKDRLSKN